METGRIHGSRSNCRFDPAPVRIVFDFKPNYVAMTDLVLLHGALGASRQLDPLAEALRSRFLVHQLDFEGPQDVGRLKFSADGPFEAICRPFVRYA